MLVLLIKKAFMKKLIFTLCFAFAAFTGFAQYDTGLRLAISTYPNIGFLSAESGKSNGQSLGFTYGLSGDYEFAENYCFSSGVLVTSINGTASIINFYPYHNVNGPLAAYDVKYKMQYLEIPLALKLKTDEVNDLKWYGLFGFTTGFRLGARQDVELSGASLASNAKANNNTSFFRTGVVIGGGAEYGVFGRTSLIGGLSYNNGLTDIAKQGSKVKNHYIAINFGVLF
jgi:hypothetical protein